MYNVCGFYVILGGEEMMDLEFDFVDFSPTLYHGVKSLFSPFFPSFLVGFLKIMRDER